MAMNRRALITGGAVAVAVAGSSVAIGVALRKSRARSDDIAAITNHPDNPVMGNARGNVTIAEFFDYQCPFCKRDHAAMMQLARQDGNIRVVMKDWPIFGGASTLASQIVLGSHALGQYEVAHNALMATPAKLSENDVRSTLLAAGVDPDAAYASYLDERKKWDDLLATNAAQAANLGLQGTPGYIIGDRLYFGALGAEGISASILDYRQRLRLI